MKVKVIGAGSIGNHLSHAARCLGWTVHLCDKDPAALARTRAQTYPARYGLWDEAIELFLAGEAPAGGYDLIVIGTPPESHVPLALKAIDEHPRGILVEKPLCTPDLDGAQQLLEKSLDHDVPVFVGYDHVVGKAAEKFANLISIHGGAPPDTLDVEFREHWGGIFAAHPWLSGPADSYLGYWQRGGGALGEHSHALNLWQHFARQLGCGRVVEVQAMMAFVHDEVLHYDKLCSLNVRTEQGLAGRVIQDVVTSPPRKWARVQGQDRYLEWHCGYEPGVDAVFCGNGRGRVEQHRFPKVRPDDFMQELRHIESALSANPASSPLYVERGLDTMLVIAAAHKSVREGRTVGVDYSAGYAAAALR